MFKNREEAGQKLAKKLKSEELINNPSETVVLGITRGGVVVARAIADYFKVALDVIIIKKIGAPNQPELAIGAIGETSGSHYLEEQMIREMGISRDYLNQEITAKLAEIKARESRYRQGRPAVGLKNKEVVIVDDGTATGATMIAALRETWNRQPKRVIVSLPVAPLDTLKKLEHEADSVVVLETPAPFFSVGQFYENFTQVTDEVVLKLLSPSGYCSQCGKD
jgi:predicted phosphoribosyltransferase